MEGITVDRITRQIMTCVTATLLVALTALPVFAQGDGESIEDIPFSDNYAGTFDVGSTPLRLWTQAGGFGQGNGHLSIGTRGVASTNSGVFFFDVQYNLSENIDYAGNLGVGYRSLHENLLIGGAPRILGASLWYDIGSTPFDNSFSQIGLSFESLGEDWDFRANVNIVASSKMQQSSDVIVGDSIVYFENTLAFSTLIPTDDAYDVFEIEAARRLMNTNFWLYAGGYQLNGHSDSGTGFEGGVRGYLWDNFFMQLGGSDDELFGANFSVNIVWTPGGSLTRGPVPYTVYDRMREPVLRNNYIATRQRYTAGGLGLHDSDGNRLHIVHVDSTASAPGDSTFESPLTNLDDVFAASQQGSIVLLHSGTTHTGQAIVLRDEQRLLGEGNNVTHSVVTSERGEIDLPETSTGSLAGAVPIIRNAPGDAVRLTTATNDVSDFESIEISNLTIDGGVRGIAASGGVGDIDINQLTIMNTTGDGIALTPLVETLADSSTQVRFRVAIDDITFDKVGGDDINLDASTAEPDSTPVVESISITNVSSTDGSGRGIRIDSNQSAVTISDYTYDGGATGTGAMLFTRSDGTVTATDITISNGSGTGIDILSGSEGTFTFTDTNITNTGGAALNVDGSEAVVTLNGEIENNAGRVVTLTANTGGTVTINSPITGTGTGILVENNTGGTFVFAGKVDLKTLANTAITLNNNSDSTTRFQDLQIETTSGTGLLATTTDSLEITGTENTIATTTGIGVSFNMVTIGGSGVNLKSISVDGATNGISLVDVTGGAFTVASGGSNPGDGGTIKNTTGAGIVLTNVANVSLNNLSIEGATGDGISITHNNSNAHRVVLDNIRVTGSSAVGIDSTASGTGLYTLSISDTTVDNTTDQNIRLAFNDGMTTANVKIERITAVNSSGDEALLVTAAGTTAKTLNILVDESRFTNNDATAVAADFQANGAVNLNATITDNTFVNNNNTTGKPFEMSANDGAATIRLALFENIAQNSNANDEYFLIQSAGTFSVEDWTAVPPNVGDPAINTAARNTGSINTTGTINNDAGNIPTP